MLNDSPEDRPDQAVGRGPMQQNGEEVVDGPRSDRSTSEPEIVAQLDGLVRHFGGDPEALSGQLVREMMQNVLRMLRDGAGNGELKLVSRSSRELRYALNVFRSYQQQRKVSIFGSARTAPDHPDYQTAYHFARELSDAGWMLITGAGDGIMRAGNEGAGRERSFGLSIRLPFETTANEFITDDEKLINFRYFFTRKLLFVSQADALALLPGGFGTLDECFEVLTLVQTGKTDVIPIVMVEPPGSGYWQHFDTYVRDHLLEKGMINPEDLHLYHIFEDPYEAALHVRDFYRNYHSQRYVGDRLVIRIRHALSERHMDLLNEEFPDLVAEGRIEQTEPLKEERMHLSLPRLTFVHTRRDYGRLRLLIDRLNQFAVPHGR